MSKPNIRYPRIHCRRSTSVPQANRDGALAVAAINEDAQLAQVLLVGIRRWDRNDGASVNESLSVLVPATHRRLVACFGTSLAETLVVKWDGDGVFFRLRFDMAPVKQGHEGAPATAARSGEHGGRSSFLAWTGPT